MPVTIKDIAKEAGVSYSTVSRALNGLSLVNDETKKHILTTAKRMGYIPNPSAVNLKLRRTNMLSLFFSTYDNLSSAMVLHSVFTSIYDLVKEDYNVIVKAVDNHVKGSLNPSSLDGIILISQQEKDREFVEEALEKHIPIALVNQKSQLNVDTVLTDERDAFYRNMKYLLDAGHREIVVLEGPKGLHSTQQRHKGWNDAVLEYDLNPKDFPIYEGKYTFESGVELADKILEHKPTALLSFNDEMAFGVERVMMHKGLRVPDDLSMIGFDNWNQTMHTYMGLTTIERNMYKLTREACSLLLDRINAKEGEEPPTKTVYLDAPFIERGSVKKINTQEQK